MASGSMYTTWRASSTTRDRGLDIPTSKMAGSRRAAQVIAGSGASEASDFAEPIAGARSATSIASSRSDGSFSGSQDADSAFALDAEGRDRMDAPYVDRVSAAWTGLARSYRVRRGV
jgi:hypothetical protein